MLYYPALLFPPDAKGLSGCAVPDLLINASGRSPDDALRDAADIMRELLHDMHMSGEPFPEPSSVDDVDASGGTLVLLPAPLPATVS